MQLLDCIFSFEHQLSPKWLTVPCTCLDSVWYCMNNNNNKALLKTERVKLILSLYEHTDQQVMKMNDEMHNDRTKHPWDTIKSWPAGSVCTLVHRMRVKEVSCIQFV